MHLYFWIFVFLSFSALYIFPEVKPEGIYKNLIYLPGDIAFTYFFLFVLNKLITKRKKYVLFIVIFTISIVAYTLLSFAIDQFIIPLVYGESLYSHYNLHTFVHSSWVIVLIALAAGYIKMIRTWHRTDADNLRLDIEKNQTHNQLLRSRINPHFLFNTLNNISSLIEFDTRKAQKSIIELADLMEYMVYEGESDHVALEKEIKYIRDFISLQELRIDRTEFVNFSVEGESGNIKIASMLLIPFVENSFKYCKKDACPGIIIKLDIRENELDFYCENEISESNVQNRKPGGFGLQNVKKRLKSLYPDKHKLTVKSDSGKFQVSLKLRTGK